MAAPVALFGVGFRERCDNDDGGSGGAGGGGVQFTVLMVL